MGAVSDWEHFTDHMETAEALLERATKEEGLRATNTLTAAQAHATMALAIATSRGAS